MLQAGRVRIMLAVAILAMIATGGREAGAQSNPYQLVANWAKMPAGRTFGSVIGAGVDREGNVWAVERCGGTGCAGRTEAPLFVFSPSGDLVKSLGAGMFVTPHGIGVDSDGSVWVTDYVAADGKGQQVFKLDPSCLTYYLA